MSAALSVDLRPNRCSVAVHALGRWETLDRFLVLGCAVGTYYASAAELRLVNLDNLLVCLDMDGARTVARIKEISLLGRAPKNLPAVMSLAVAASLGLRRPVNGHFNSADRTGDNENRANTRRLALLALPDVCRIPTDLFAWVSWVKQLRGWGPALARAVARWYETSPVDRLALHAIKYQERHGMRHADLLRLAHPKVGEDDPARQAVIRWMKQGGVAQGLDARERSLSQGVLGNPTPSGAIRQLEAAEDLLSINRPAAVKAAEMAQARAAQRAEAKEMEIRREESNWARNQDIASPARGYRWTEADSSLQLFGVSTHMLQAADAQDYLSGTIGSGEVILGYDNDNEGAYDWVGYRGSHADDRKTAPRLPKPPRPSLFAQEDVSRAVELIESCSLPHEVVPSHLKRETKIWDALLVSMPMKAMLRNLSAMTVNGVLVEGNAASRFVAERLVDPVFLRKARIHPVALLMAAETYRAGHTPYQITPSAPVIWGKRQRKNAYKPRMNRARRHETWTPVPGIIRALEHAFVLAFSNVVPSGKRLMNALDVSGSMGSPIANSGITARVAAAAMSLVSVKTEPHVNTVCFTSANFYGENSTYERDNGLIPGLSKLDVNQDSTLRRITSLTADMPFGSTDCALPIMYALQAGLEIDCFAVYTDSEHNSGEHTPSQALALYREATGIQARLVCVGMTATDYTIADPNDALCLNIAGFDSAVPSLIADFAAGRV